VTYAIRWVDYARDQREALPAGARGELDAALRMLAADPRAPGTYSEREEQWTTPFGGGWGVVLYSIEERWLMVTILRVTWAG